MSPTRELTSHRVNGCNSDIKIEVLDEPGSGGANHKYQCSWGGAPGDPNAEVLNIRMIDFQNGPIPENGVNGLTHEVLLAIVADRLRSFQDGPFACFENERALNHVQEALGWLHHRTSKRIARGVEGALQK